MLTLHGSTFGYGTPPSVLLGCIFLLLGYLAFVRFRPKARFGWFVAGVAIIFAALSDPLDELGDTYLFSAHMLQHLLLILLVPPFILLGLPSNFLKRIRRNKFADKLERILSTPVLAWFLSIGTLWFWHIPFFYEAALHSEEVHIIEHFAFIATSTLYWWLLLKPEKSTRLKALPALIYLFTAMAANSVLGIYLTFSQAGLYPSYVNPADPLGILSILRRDLNLTPKIDLQIGGLMMWVPGNLVYLFALFGALARWFKEDEERQYQELYNEAADS